MNIYVAGTRGIPNIQGGIESHCEALYPIIVEEGKRIVVTRREVYVTDDLSEFNGVELLDLYSPRNQSYETIVHTFFAVWSAFCNKADILHIHAIGPSIAIPFARLLGLKVVMTHHGTDYNRQKWSRFAKLCFIVGEWCAAFFANEMIVISEGINKLIKEKYGRNDAHLIYNGVKIPKKTEEISYLNSIGLEPQKYIIAVGRFVPEKGFHDLVRASKKIDSQFKIVIVGDSDHPSEYSDKLKQDAISNGIVLTGFIKGEKLHQIYSHAALFVMTSYHEGLPIALLEAMSYNLKVAVSNISANLEVNLSPDVYFPVGNIEEIYLKINRQLALKSQVDYSIVISEKYNWDKIAKQTNAVYKRLMD